MSGYGVRRVKAAFLSGCKSHPAILLQPEAIGAVMEVTKWLGNLAMFANCERTAKAEKLSRVMFSQLLGSVMTGRHMPEGKTSECNEVKGVCPESEP